MPGPTGETRVPHGGIVGRQVVTTVVNRISSIPTGADRVAQHLCLKLLMRMGSLLDGAYP